MNPRFDLIIYPKAKEDLDSIFDYIKDTLKSPKAAYDLTSDSINNYINYYIPVKKRKR